MRWNKYNVTFEQWEAGHYFPEFCGGPCTGFTSRGTSGILESAKKTDAKGFKLEDVLFTGEIALREEIKMKVPNEMLIKGLFSIRVSYHISV